MERTSSARANAITPRATDTVATTAQLIARRANIVAAVVEPVRDRARAAQTSRTMHRTRVKDQSIQITAAGNAMQDTTTKTASVSAAPTKAVERTSSARVHVITRVATATSATAVLQTARQGSIVAAAAARVRARVRDAPMHLRMHRTRVRAQST